MPSLTIAYSTPFAATPSRRGEVARLLTVLTERHLGKQGPLTAVTVTEVPPEDWFVGGRSLADLGEASHHVVVRVTEGTNTKSEKARFLAAVHADLGRLLGPSRPESYVVVDEIRADAWGFGGETQEYRAIAGKLAGEAETALVFDAYRRFGVR